MASLTRFLEKKLKLTVNPAKSKVAPLDQCRFLGFTFRRGKIVWSEKSLAKFQRRVRELTGRSWGVVPCHGNPSEPPDADPHVRWCGGREV